MKKWEYSRWYWKYGKCDSSHGKYENILTMMDDLGSRGWELVSVVPDISSNDVHNAAGIFLGTSTESTAEIFYFKRPIE